MCVKLTINVPLILKVREIIFFSWAKPLMGHFEVFLRGQERELELERERAQEQERGRKTEREREKRERTNVRAIILLNRLGQSKIRELYCTVQERAV
jgi:hypothetical protein